MIMEKYIYENDTIYELDKQEHYNPVIFMMMHENCQRGNYAKVRFNFLVENSIEFLVYLENNDKFDDYFLSYQKEMVTQENNIVSKMPKQNVIDRLMVRELLMYQDIS